MSVKVYPINTVLTQIIVQKDIKMSVKVNPINTVLTQIIVQKDCHAQTNNT